MLLTLLLACAAPVDPVCVPGETQECLCAGAASGAQACGVDGLGWEVCDCGSGPLPDSDADTDADSDTDTSADGEALYNANCASCHAADGRGTAAGPSLQGESREMSDAELAETIREGDDDMPAFPSLAAAEVTAVVAWIRELCGPYVPEEDDD